MLAANPPPGGSGNRIGGELAVVAGDVDQLDSRQQLRRAALVDIDVRVHAGDHRLPGTRRGAQSGDIGTGAVPDQEGFRLLTELGLDPVLHPRGPLVGAVGTGGTLVGSQDRGHHRRMRWCGVVAPELARQAHESSSVMLSSHSASTLPSGSATIAIIPKPCCTGSVSSETPFDSSDAFSA